MQRLRGHRLGGNFWIRTEHLQEGLREHQVAETATEERGPEEGGEEGADRENPKWELVVELIQTAFRYGLLEE